MRDLVQAHIHALDNGELRYGEYVTCESCKRTTIIGAGHYDACRFCVAQARSANECSEDRALAIGAGFYWDWMRNRWRSVDALVGDYQREGRAVADMCEEACTALDDGRRRPRGATLASMVQETLRRVWTRLERNQVAA